MQWQGEADLFQRRRAGIEADANRLDNGDRLYACMRSEQTNEGTRCQNRVSQHKLTVRVVADRRAGTTKRTESATTATTPATTAAAGTPKAATKAARVGATATKCQTAWETATDAALTALEARNTATTRLAQAAAAAATGTATWTPFVGCHTQPQIPMHRTAQKRTTIIATQSAQSVRRSTYAPIR